MAIDYSRQVDPILLQKLGEVVTEWAIVDEFTGRLLSGLVGANSTSMLIVTQNVSANSQTTWCRTLLSDLLKDNHGRETALNLLSEIDELRAERNGLVHGLWSGGEIEGTAVVQTYRLDRPDIIVSQLLTAAELEELITRIVEARTHLARLVIGLGFSDT